MMIGSFLFLFIPPLFILGYQALFETKGINDPILSFSMCKTTILMDLFLKLFLVGLVYVGLIQDFDVFAIISMFVDSVFFFSFYFELALKIPKKYLRKNRKYPQETNYTICAFKYVLWGVFSMICTLAILLLLPLESVFEVLILCSVMIIMIVLCMVMIVRTLIRLDRLKKPSIRSLNGLNNNNSPIVLLRSFKIDSNPTLDGKVFDETICENLDLENNPIISLANPDEILPSGGSLKIQAKDSEWQEVVKEVLKNCRAVIIVEGLSEGLQWEISKLKQYLKPSQLFVLVPSDKYRELAWCYNDNAGTGLFSITRNLYRFMNIMSFRGRKENKKILDSVWLDFSERLNRYGIHMPKMFPGENILLNFDSCWNVLKQEHICDMRDTLKNIVRNTAVFNKPDFDYPMLGRKVAMYEVNGFLKKEDVALFKKLVDKYNKIGNCISASCFILFVLLMLLF